MKLSKTRLQEVLIFYLGEISSWHVVFLFPRLVSYDLLSRGCYQEPRILLHIAVAPEMLPKPVDEKMNFGIVNFLGWVLCLG
jgi:hypothetical protein